MHLTKHHGLGNDFLVLLDLAGTHRVTPAEAAALCDRRTGIGADGLLRATAGSGGADVTMELFNADGSVAEMSGNGIRCLAQAVFRSGAAAPPVLDVATAAGRRTVRVVSEGDGSTQRMSVEMGQAKVIDAELEPPTPDVVRAARVDVGNPHVVLLWRRAELPGSKELVALGEPIDRTTPGGANVEVVRAGAGPDEIQMVVYERGVGPTQACGTGACAVAAAAHEWGLAGTTATVHMPGGPVAIALGDPVLLTGDVTYVAHIDTPWP
jgi:diaminopimelate epimerase